MQKSRSIFSGPVPSRFSKIFEAALRLTPPFRRSINQAVLGFSFLTIGSTAAAMTITGVENMSQPIDLTQTPLVIYGGIAGSPGSGSTGTVDSCASLTTPYGACNSARITTSTILRIHTNTTATTVGYPRIFYVSGSNSNTTTTGNVIPNDPSSPTSAGAGDSYVAVKWGDICNAVNDGSLNGCTQTLTTTTSTAAALNGTFRIGYTTGQNDSNLPTADTIDVKIVVSGYMGTTSSYTDTTSGTTTTDNVFAADCGDTNGNDYGICAFQMTAGDEKATIFQPHTDNGLTGPALQFSGVRVLYEKTTFNSPTYNQITAHSPHTDLSLSTDANGNLAIGGSGRVTGLINDQTYAFKLAMIDLAGNIGLYTLSATGANASVSGDNYCPDANRTTNCHLATPEQVVGVLSKDLSCFIATAAFGSQMAPEVETFRQFRNHFLLTTKWGTEFVRFYYRHSPKYAAIIAHSETLRSIARLFLWPLLGYAWLALHIGAKSALALMALLLGSIFLIGYRLATSDDEDGGPQGSQRA